MPHGHVFVAPGDLAHLSSDAVVVPTDRGFHLEPYWYETLGLGDDPSADRAARLRPVEWPADGYGPAPGEAFTAADGDVADGDDDERRRVWFIDVVPTRATGGTDGAAEIADRVLRLLEAVAADDALAARTGRLLPLVALPVLGVGKGSLGGARGDVVARLVAACTAFTRRHAIDVVIVARHASDFSAFQDARQALDDSPLPDDLESQARDLAHRARRGELALFVGAGVSMGAGLPGWRDLLAALAERAGSPDLVADLAALSSPLDQAQLLQQELGEDLRRHLRDILGCVRRYALAHALLASLGCDAVVTTNYDTLYEQALGDAVGAGPATLPFDDAQAGEPWVLKMHGDLREGSRPVLSRSDVVGFDSGSGPVGAMVQSLLLTRHLLIVGASLTDDNFLRLAHEVASFRETHTARSRERRPMGTVVALADNPGSRRLWQGRFEFVATHVPSPGHTGRAAQARDLALFLDRVALHASTPRYAADERYEGLLLDDEVRAAHDARRLLAAIDGLPPDARGRWRLVREALEASGASRSPDLDV